MYQRSDLEMAKELTALFTCDLCGDKTKSPSNQVPQGWINKLIQNPHVDRDFTEKHVCDECCLDIKKRHKA